MAFATSAVTIGVVVVARSSSTSIPNVMVSSTDAAYNLTVNNSASGSYALKVMTVVAVIFFPLVLLYQGWSFHVFRGRIAGPVASADQPAPPPPIPPSPAGPASASAGT